MLLFLFTLFFVAVAADDGAESVVDVTGSFYCGKKLTVNFGDTTMNGFAVLTVERTFWDWVRAITGAVYTEDVAIENGMILEYEVPLLSRIYWGKKMELTFLWGTSEETNEVLAFKARVEYNCNVDVELGRTPNALVEDGDGRPVGFLLQDTKNLNALSARRGFEQFRRCDALAKSTKYHRDVCGTTVGSANCHCLATVFSLLQAEAEIQYKLACRERDDTTEFVQAVGDLIVASDCVAQPCNAKDKPHGFCSSPEVCETGAGNGYSASKKAPVCDATGGVCCQPQCSVGVLLESADGEYDSEKRVYHPGVCVSGFTADMTSDREGRSCYARSVAGVDMACGGSHCCVSAACSSDGKTLDGVCMSRHKCAGRDGMVINDEFAESNTRCRAFIGSQARCCILGVEKAQEFVITHQSQVPGANQDGAKRLPAFKKQEMSPSAASALSHSASSLVVAALVSKFFL